MNVGSKNCKGVKLTYVKYYKGWRSTFGTIKCRTTDISKNFERKMCFDFFILEFLYFYICSNYSNTQHI